MESGCLLEHRIPAYRGNKWKNDPLCVGAAGCSVVKFDDEHTGTWADLKDAMRNKYTNKLNVLRSLLAEITNASKTPSPSTTDLPILALITKAQSKSADSFIEFRAAGHKDLAEREADQLAVLDSYSSQVETIGKGEIVAVVKSVVGGGAKDMGSVIRKVLKVFEGKPVVKREVAAIVKQALAK